MVRDIEGKRSMRLEGEGKCHKKELRDYEQKEQSNLNLQFQDICYIHVAL